MKSIKKNIIIGTVCILMAVLTACGASTVSNKNTAAQAPMEYAVEEFAAEDAVIEEETADTEDSFSTSGESGIQNVQQQDRKIIWTVNMHMETKDITNLLNGLNKQIEEYNGYIEYSSISGNNQNHNVTRRANVTARIPSDKLDVFLEQMGQLGIVTESDRHREDITFKYNDTSNRIKSLRIEQERLFELLEKATDLESIILLEQRLTEVRLQIENYTSTLNLYDNQVNYSTVYLYIREVGHVSKQQDDSIAARISTGLSETFYDIKVTAEDIFVFTIVNLPVIVIYAVLIGIAAIAVKKVRKRLPKSEILPIKQKTDENEQNKENNK